LDNNILEFTIDKLIFRIISKLVSLDLKQAFDKVLAAPIEVQS